MTYRDAPELLHMEGFYSSSRPVMQKYGGFIPLECILTTVEGILWPVRQLLCLQDVQEVSY